MAEHVVTKSACMPISVSFALQFCDLLIGFVRLLQLLQIGTLSFDKDDDLAVEFVTAASNLRATNYAIDTQVCARAPRSQCSTCLGG